MLLESDGINSDEKEEWRDVPGFPNYQVSNLGRVKSLSRSHQWGTHIYQVPEKILKPWSKKSKKSWYPRVGPRINGKSYDRPIHKLVWQAFRGEIPKGLELNHKNGNKEDPRLSNLELVTHSQNIKHAYDTGLIPPRDGERNSNAKLNSEKAEQIRIKYSQGKSTKELADEYGVCTVTIAYIIRGKQWKNAGGPTQARLLRWR